MTIFYRDVVSKSPTLSSGRAPNLHTPIQLDISYDDDWDALLEHKKATAGDTLRARFDGVIMRELPSPVNTGQG
jgi:hypothetical protein